MIETSYEAPNAFNIGWHEIPKRGISSFIPPRWIAYKAGYAGAPKAIIVTNIPDLPIYETRSV
jgi:hypothetical protein